jgi:formylglycine-generating enzyme required for sulfatase activity
MKPRKNTVDRAIRAGSFVDGTYIQRVSYRLREGPVYRYGNYGFRLIIRKKA